MWQRDGDETHVRPPNDRRHSYRNGRWNLVISSQGITRVSLYRRFLLPVRYDAGELRSSPICDSFRQFLNPIPRVALPPGSRKAAKSSVGVAAQIKDARVPLSYFNQCVYRS